MIHMKATLTRSSGEIHAQLVDNRRLGRLAVWRALTLLRVGGRLVQNVNNLGANLVKADAERLEDAGSDAFTFTHQTKQQMLGADVVVVEAARLVDR